MIRAQQRVKVSEDRYEMMSPFDIAGRDGVLTILDVSEGYYAPGLAVNNEAEAEAWWREYAHIMLTSARTIPIHVTNCKDEKEYHFEISLEELCRLILRNLEAERERVAAHGKAQVSGESHQPDCWLGR